jgi:malate dehydrogenase
MTVWGAGAVEAARGELRVAAGDVVTPLARERAAELGVRIVTAGGGGAARPSSGGAARGVGAGGAGGDGVRGARGGSASAARGRWAGGAAPAVSGALFRRGAPLPRGAAGRGVGAGTGGRRVMVVGAGHVGMMTAARLADADVFGEIVLVDVVEGLAAGIALDLTHTAGLAGFRTQVTGAVTVEDAGPADYVVITAGRARQPGMSRSDLLSTNAAIVGDIASRVAVVAPSAVLVVVTNPLDEMTQHAWRASGWPPSRVIGMAGVLDTARFRALAAQAAGLRPDQIRAVALGSHGAEMVIPLSQASAAGRPITEVLGQAETAAIVNRTRDSGAEVVGLLKHGSAFMAPGAAAARMVLAMATGSDGPLAASVLADGSYGIEGVYLGLPVRLGPGGVREIVELALTAGELTELRRAAERIGLRVSGLPAVSGSSAVLAGPAPRGTLAGVS